MSSNCIQTCAEVCVISLPGIYIYIYHFFGLLDVVSCTTSLSISFVLFFMSLCRPPFKLPEDSRRPVWGWFPARQEGDWPEEDVHQQRPSSKFSGQCCSVWKFCIFGHIEEGNLLSSTWSLLKVWVGFIVVYSRSLIWITVYFKVSDALNSLTKSGKSFVMWVMQSVVFKGRFWCVISSHFSASLFLLLSFCDDFEGCHLYCFPVFVLEYWYEI